MEIKNVDLLSQIAAVKQKQVKNPDAAVSFMDYMKSRMAAQDPLPEDDGGFSVNELFDANGIEAIGARARIRQDSGGDVTDFLELINKKPYILNGIDLSGLNDTSSTKALSEEDLRHLREGFDADNLSPEKLYELFSELVGLRALSKADVQKTQLSVAPGEDDLMAYLSKEPGFKDVSAIDASDPKSRLDAMINNERLAYSHIQSRYGKRCTSVNELADSHERVLNTLKQI